MTDTDRQLAEKLAHAFCATLKPGQDAHMMAVIFGFEAGLTKGKELGRGEVRGEWTELYERFKELVGQCEWYASNGTDQERHHFLACEARGNFLDLKPFEVKNEAD